MDHQHLERLGPIRQSPPPIMILRSFLPILDCVKHMQIPPDIVHIQRYIDNIRKEL